jgi:hypothetical protein
MLHELWVDSEGLDTFVLAGPMDDEKRMLIGPEAKVVWTVEAGSHFEAMSLYYEYRGWGIYTTQYPENDMKPYEEMD